MWASTTTLAMEIISWYGRLKENHQAILSPEWWAQVRYYHFGSELTDKLGENEDLKQELRALFKACDDKLQYYDFFQFVS